MKHAKSDFGLHFKLKISISKKKTDKSEMIQKKETNKHEMK